MSAGDHLDDDDNANATKLIKTWEEEGFLRRIFTLKNLFAVYLISFFKKVRPREVKHLYIRMGYGFLTSGNYLTANSLDN